MVEKVKETKKVEEPKSITIQHIGRVRQFTVSSKKVVKIYRGAVKMKHPRFLDNVVLNPGCIVEVTPELASWLIAKRDFQKYGVDK